MCYRNLTDPLNGSMDQLNFCSTYLAIAFICARFEMSTCLDNISKQLLRGYMFFITFKYRPWQVLVVQLANIIGVLHDALVLE